MDNQSMSMSSKSTHKTHDHGALLLLHPLAMVMLHSTTGSSKSSLIHAQQQLWYKQHGWVLATGKFLANQEQFQEPFSALIEACNELIEAWMQRNDTAIVWQLGGFQLLFDGDVEYLQHILPKAYQAVQARALACLCGGPTFTSSTSKDDTTAETSLGEEEGAAAAENAVLNPIPPVVMDDTAACKKP
ncbi:hypothetical protein ACA910_016673 [Epithemia clementina (nom. ined.)]